LIDRGRIVAALRRSRSAAIPIAWICRRPGSRRHDGAVISTDAHGVSDFDNIEYGVAMARRGGVQRSEVLNALLFEAFSAAVRPR